ncbi:MAG TPA: hypothetical protein VH986_07820 [Acidimicrobiia bacterium]|jgi:DNA-binding winged helix-turn-helix (wHTH) protein
MDQFGHTGVALARDALARGSRSVRLSRRESKLVALLLERSPDPLCPRDLAHVLWPARAPSDLAHRRELVRLRRRLAVVGLALRFRPRVGYTLEASPWTSDGGDVRQSAVNSGANSVAKPRKPATSTASAT